MTSQLPPIYVISLVRETARRENIKQRLTALGANYEFFNAVDGKALQPSQYTHRMQTRHHFLKEGFEMTSGEIGCFMSHHNLWQKIADGKNEYALVLEDDAVWDNDFADVINQVLTCKWHWEVVLRPIVWRGAGRTQWNAALCFQNSGKIQSKGARMVWQ